MSTLRKHQLAVIFDRNSFLQTHLPPLNLWGNVVLSLYNLVPGLAPADHLSTTWGVEKLVLAFTFFGNHLESIYMYK